jgi:pyrimidine operon attenuation protein / uracil phosphoribosyltransferase
MKALKTITGAAVRGALEKVAGAIAARHGRTKGLCVVGIANGGIIFGQRLAKLLTQKLGREIPCGIVNPSFHRDDIGLNPIPKEFHRTEMPFPVENAVVILADDVLFTGRTARASLDEIFGQGRPERVELAALCDRGHRRLPLQADYTGLTLETTPEQDVKVTLSAEKPDEDNIILYSA